MNAVPRDSVFVDVCIATYKRPAMLATLLLSLLHQRVNRIGMRIVVIDNDAEMSAKRLVDDFRSQTASEIVYDVEPRQNIALARNRALSHVRSRYFAFIDDDEAASETWLQSLVDCAVKYQADVVFGPVLRALPDDAPAWASDCFRIDRLETGREVEFGGAGNVLLRSDILRRVAVRFDAAFGLTGGEDTDFFYRLHLSGCKLVWCDEALASEPVAPSRLTLQWVRRRGFRGGQTYNRVFVRRYTRLRKIRWFLVKTAHLAGGLVAAPVLRLLSYPSYVALTVRIAAATGQLSACFLERGFEEYSAKRYR